MSVSVIEVSRLTRDYGKGKGVFDLSFGIEKGEVFGFLGPNGAGKTTTIRHLMGFIRAKEGTCTINGMDCRKDADKIQRHVGYIPGEIAFFNEMTERNIFVLSRNTGETRPTEKKSSQRCLS